MSADKRKARPTAATVEQAAGCDFAGQSSQSEYTTFGVSRQSGVVSSLLMTGEANALPARELVALLGVKDCREVSKLVERERRAGVPICASVSGEDRGYYLASTPAELERYLRSLDRRLKSIRLTREACQDTLLRMIQQEQIVG